ncbi:site-specific DNA-methyltransferase (adenine-specific) [Flexibacter flexilis DSM 6793]|uniref:Methyltransferase n=2 Tax=Flexibacter flexilis TaxID=998 RepID=A0A1I1DZK7_9BACT|nr:site-specific DNA-methyltransferase (adenine-specific) [Flexibacter flexilis DSM 6793]
MPENSVDVVLTDPPYLYLKHKLDRPFDEATFFSEIQRIVKPDGFVVIFGRGASFYRWNTRLAELGFAFKEEIIWDKKRISSPLMALGRRHETISISTKGKGKIKACKVPYLEMKRYDEAGILRDLKSLKGLLKTKKLDNVIAYLEKNTVVYSQKRGKESLTIGAAIATPDRQVTTLKSIVEGMKEQSIIEVAAERGSVVIHPTQKPVRLLVRLLALVGAGSNSVVFDPFAGSSGVAVAADEIGAQFVGSEIDEEYYNAAVRRISAL